MRSLVSATPLSTNKHLIRWVEKMADLTKPAAIHWVDGSQAENDALCAEMVSSGTFTKLNEELWPGCYYARSDASDVARVEDRTFICSLSKESAGPTNNWVNPFEMRRKLKSLFKGCMRGRTMYVLPFSMGPVDSPMSQIGVELTDYADHGPNRTASLPRNRQGFQARRAVHAQCGRTARTRSKRCSVAL